MHVISVIPQRTLWGTFLPLQIELADFAERANYSQNGQTYSKIDKNCQKLKGSLLLSSEIIVNNDNIKLLQVVFDFYAFKDCHTMPFCSLEILQTGHAVLKKKFPKTRIPDYASWYVIVIQQQIKNSSVAISVQNLFVLKNQKLTLSDKKKLQMYSQLIFCFDIVNKFKIIIGSILRDFNQLITNLVLPKPVSPSKTNV